MADLKSARSTVIRSILPELPISLRIDLNALQQSIC